MEKALSGEFGVSQLGTLSAAKVTPIGGEPIIVISAYGIIKPTEFESNGLNLIQIDENREVTISLKYEHEFSHDSVYQIGFAGKK